MHDELREYSAQVTSTSLLVIPFLVKSCVKSWYAAGFMDVIEDFRKGGRALLITHQLRIWEALGLILGQDSSLPYPSQVIIHRHPSKMLGCVVRQKFTDVSGAAYWLCHGADYTAQHPRRQTTASHWQHHDNLKSHPSFTSVYPMQLIKRR